MRVREKREARQTIGAEPIVGRPKAAVAPNSAMLASMGVQAGGQGEGPGLEMAMKDRLARRFGLPFDDVRVHYHSEKPAQMQALAFTQGNEVFLGPGQERHLGHELAHVVQQKQGRVRPTGAIMGAPLNDSPSLELEADAQAVPRLTGAPAPGGEPVVQRLRVRLNKSERDDALFSALRRVQVNKTHAAATNAEAGGAVENAFKNNANLEAENISPLGQHEDIVLEGHGVTDQRGDPAKTIELLDGPRIADYVAAIVKKTFSGEEEWEGRVVLLGCGTAELARQASVEIQKRLGYAPRVVGTLDTITYGNGQDGQPFAAYEFNSVYHKALAGGDEKAKTVPVRLYKDLTGGLLSISAEVYLKYIDISASGWLGGNVGEGIRDILPKLNKVTGNTTLRELTECFDDVRQRASDGPSAVRDGIVVSTIKADMFTYIGCLDKIKGIYEKILHESHLLDTFREAFYKKNHEELELERYEEIRAATRDAKQRVTSYDAQLQALQAQVNALGQALNKDFPPFRLLLMRLYGKPIDFENPAHVGIYQNGARLEPEP